MNFSQFSIWLCYQPIWLPYWSFNMGNSIGAVMDGFSGKGCTFFILIGFWVLKKGKKRWNMSFFLLIISLESAPASPICFQSELALRFIFGITAAKFSHHSFNNEQELRRQRAIQDAQFVQFPPLWLFFNVFFPQPVLHWILNCCPQALGVHSGGEMKFLTTLLTKGAKWFYSLPWVIK